MNWQRHWSRYWAWLRASWYLRVATSVGSRPGVWGHPAIHNYGRMVIGERFRLISTIARSEIFTGPKGELCIGDRVYINYGCSISAQELIRIGDGVTIGTHCILMDNDFHSINPERRHERPPSSPISLEENVWLGARVIVLKGVTIGRNTVIGAGSVVTRSMPSGCVAAGSPARILRKLDSLPAGTGYSERSFEG